MITINDLIDFAWKNRRGKAFSFTEKEYLIHEICQAIQQNCLSFCVSRTGKLNGLVTGSVIPEQSVFFVTNILATERGVLNALLAKFTGLYPNYSLEARRKGKIKRYNTTKLINKVSSLTQKGII